MMERLGEDGGEIKADSDSREGTGRNESSDLLFSLYHQSLSALALTQKLENKGIGYHLPHSSAFPDFSANGGL